MAETSQTTIVPHTQQPLENSTRQYPSESKLDEIIDLSSRAQKSWAKVPLDQRIKVGWKLIDEVKAMSDDIPLELTMQMGRPVSQGAGEIRGFVERATYLLEIAEKTLADVIIPEPEGNPPKFKRYIRRAPLGVVLIVSPWNFPYLTIVNSLIPAIISGNSVLLKPSPQTPLAAERLAKAFAAAGLPDGVLTVLHLSPALTAYVTKHPKVEFVSFTGSVAGGQALAREAAQGRGKGVGLELGGKDPAYVRADADLAYSVENLVDGALFNSGQSCCAIERIYVHESLFDNFVKEFAEVVKGYKLGDPTLKETNLGPVVSVASAKKIQAQVDAAVKAGAKALIPSDIFASAVKPDSAFVAPQVLVDVDHTMEIMTEETFGPVVGIQKVKSDEEAVQLINDSKYGLTASIWTKDPAAAEALVDEIETGTVFLNRCDYLDPALAWTGVKDSGRGVSLSKFGYDQLTRAKSVHLKLQT